MTRFRIVAVALLLWNLAGVVAFVTQVRSRPEDLGDAVTAQAFATMPTWAWMAYAVATIAGTLAAIALLLRRRIAAPLFVLSLISMVAQFSWSIFGFGMVSLKGPGTLVFPIVIVAIAAFGAWYARRAALEGKLR